MVQASQKPFNLTPGDSPTLRFEILASNEEPFNLADFAVDFYIQRSVQDVLASAVWHGSLGAGVNLGAEVQDGLLDVTIPALVTAAMRYHRSYPWFLRLSNTVLTEKIYVPARGTFLLALTAV